MKTVHDKNAEQVLKNPLRNIDPNLGLSQMAGIETEDNDFRDTKFGACQVESCLCYQVAVTESNRLHPQTACPKYRRLEFPTLPIRNIEHMAIPGNLSE